MVMAPGGGKRKRNDRGSVDSGDSRPSPHHPSGINNIGGGGGGGFDRGDMRNGQDPRRRTSRGGSRGGARPRDGRRNSGNQNDVPVVPMRSASGPMSPPARRPSNTQPQTPMAISTPSPAAQAQTPPHEPKRTIVPYDYSYLTDDRLATWSTAGRLEIIASGARALAERNTLDLSSIFQEIIQAGMDGRIDPTDAGICVKDILGPDTAPEKEIDGLFDGPTLFLDCLSIMTDMEEVNTSLRRLVVASGVSQVLMRQILDTTLLQNLGLTRTTFFKAGIRQATHLLYRQANHNLLREETEGYSKLVTELFTTSGSEPPTSEVVEDTFERVKGLIGTFDLDVGRVLDVTLDVFAAVLIKQFRFFIKFLRVSSWWPRESSDLRSSAGTLLQTGGLPKWALPGSSGWATTEQEDELSNPQREERDRLFWDRARTIGLDAFFELGGRQAIDAKTKEELLASTLDKDEELDANRQWIESTGTMPPPGNRVAAQLLGFKLRFYSSPAREKDDTLPANLIYLTALLIKIGFISLRDLYPHLWPLDDAMGALKDARMKELAEKEKANRPGGGKNALMMAGALADDTLPSAARSRDVPSVTSKPDTTTTAPAEPDLSEALPEPSDQKVLLLINLLTIGAIPESLFMLGRFPWLPEAYPEILDLIHRILHHSIQKVYESSQGPSIFDEDMQGKKWADTDQTSVPKGSVRRNDAQPRKPLRWPFPERYDVNEGMTYRFYWDEWADNVPVCQNVDDIFTLCGTLLNYSGVNIGRDSALLSKLASIGTESLARDHSEANLARWQDLLKRLLVPALSLTKSNTSVANEIYDMLRYYPGPVRYSIYAEWFEGQISRLPAMATAFSRARLETLSTMKRISMTNLTAMARTLAKTAYANPGVVFKVALDQIEAYSNLTEVVVECAKYFTDLGYDVLIWSLMSALGGKSRSRTRDDSALLTSRWLIALSKFSGKVFKRYSIMNPAPILQYVNAQLYRGNATDLIILEELIAQMSGVVSDTDFTDSQLLAMTGGELLRRQTLVNLQDMRFESAKTAKRLMRSLTETKLAGQLLVSIAQHRQSAIYDIPEEDAHIKYLATMVDETQRILIQYLDLLRSNLSVEQFDALVPDTSELMADFGLEPALAFVIGRASFARRLAAIVPVSKNEMRDQLTLNGSVSQLDADGDIGMVVSDGETQKQETLVVDEGVATVDIAMADLINGDVESLLAVTDLPSSSVPDPWREVLAPLVTAVQVTLPAKIWRTLSPEFYVIFWQLSLPDINLPMDSYTAENARLTREISDIMRDRTDMSRPGMTRKEEARKVIETTRDNLLKESKQEMIKYERSRSRLNREKSQWFSNAIGKSEALNDTLLEECFLPRLLLSPSDADYCFKMIKFLHNNGTPNFRTLGLYDRIFRGNRLRSLIFACTIREAECLGRFLKLILGDIARWHASKAVYEKEAFGANRDLPGFAKKLGKDLKPLSLCDYEEFRQLVYMWHKQLNSALRACLVGTEWMHIRNAITILKSVVESFPAVDFMGRNFQTTLTSIGAREKDKREDLSLLANALMPELKKREKKWVIMQAFSTGLGEPSQQANGNSNSQSTILEQANSKTALKPTAPEFHPQPRVTSNGMTVLRPTGKEVEDGEVDDAKTLAPGTSARDATTENSLRSNSRPPPVSSSSLIPASQLAQNSGSSIQSDDTRAREVMLKGPAQSPATLPSRPEVRAGLPTRPDLPVPRGVLMDSHGRLRPDRRDAQRIPDRQGDNPRDRPRDFPAPDRRGPDFIQRETGRQPDRILEYDRDRDRHEPFHRGGSDMPRDIRDRDRSVNGGRLSRHDPMGPPRSTNPTPERNPLVNSDRLALINPERPELINPARAALISGDRDAPRPDGSRGGREDRRERTSSRPHSPRQNDRYGNPDRDLLDNRRSDRPPIGRDPPGHLQDLPRVRHEDNQTTPAGPRNDRPGDRGGIDRPRDASAFEPNQISSRAMDPNHGRLNQSSNVPGESNFGRLGATSSQSDIPSGPRGVGRHASGSQQMRSNDVRPPPQEAARPPTPERRPPTGPASTRPPPRASTGQFNSPSTPQTPSSIPGPSPAVHPDRLKHLDIAKPSVTAPTVPTIPTPQPITPSGLHPDRARAFQNESGRTPPVLQTSNIRPGPSGPSPINAGPPSGPKGHQASGPAVSTPSSFNTPTGPSSSSSNDHSRPAQGDRRRFAGINNTLQQAGHHNGPERSMDRGASIRGRSLRMSSGPSMIDGPNSGPPTPINAPRPDLRDGGSGRDIDLFASRPGPTAENERPGSQGAQASGSGREHSSRHSGRHSHRQSRDQTPEGHRSERKERPQPEEEQGASGFRESRGGGRGRRDGGRDSGRRSTRDSTGIVAEREGGRRDSDRGNGNLPTPSGPQARGNEAEWPAWNPGNGNGNGSGIGGGAGNGNSHGSGGSGRNRENRGGDDRRSRNTGSREDGGGSASKRRGEEGGMNTGREKRPRHGN